MSEPTTTPESAPTFASAFLQALGIDPTKVVAMTIKCVGGDVPTVEITRIACDGDGKALRGVGEQFKLVRTAAPATPVAPQEPVLSLGSLQRIPLAKPVELLPGLPK